MKRKNLLCKNLISKQACLKARLFFLEVFIWKVGNYLDEIWPCTCKYQEWLPVRWNIGKYWLPYLQFIMQGMTVFNSTGVQIRTYSTWCSNQVLRIQCQPHIIICLVYPKGSLISKYTAIFCEPWNHMTTINSIKSDML